MELKLPERARIRSSVTYMEPHDPAHHRILIDFVERLSGRHALARSYLRVLARHRGGECLWHSALDDLRITLTYDVAPLRDIPRKGPLVFIGNHPFGVVDGLALCSTVSLLRERFRVLAHTALCRDDVFGQYFLSVDFSETREAVMTNISTKRRALEVLERGEAIVIFPAGGIATAETLFGPVRDLEWKTFVSKLVRASRATVVPVFFHGRNSRFFQVASQISQTLRKSLLIREITNKIGSTVRFRIGKPIPFELVNHISDRRELTEFLRRATHELADDE